MTVPQETVVCRWCNIDLSDDHKGPCPQCGKIGRKFAITFKENISIKDSFAWKSQREFFEENTKIKWIIITITTCTPFIGFFVLGTVGLILGSILSIITYYLGPHAITKVREIEHSPQRLK